MYIAAQQKADHVITEIAADIFHIGFEFTIFKDFVEGQVRAQIRTGRNDRLDLTRLQDIQDRTGPGVADAKQQKIKGLMCRQHHQVGLQAARSGAGSGGGPLAGPDEIT
jgi:hypothetical protein